MTIAGLSAFIRAELAELYSSAECKVIIPALFTRFGRISPLEYVVHSQSFVNENTVSLIKQAVCRLKKSEPLEYVISSAHFLDLELWVNPYVLIPRPETEELVQIVTDELKDFRSKNLQIADLGTGSGCIALSLKKRFIHADVLATDISLPAIATARYNAKVHCLNVQFLIHDMLKQSTLPLAKGLDVLVSNPPYVLIDEKILMQKNVLDFEPEMALYAPINDPIAFYRRLKDFSLCYLVSDGLWIFEINENLQHEVLHLFEDTNDSFYDIRIISDAFGKSRFIVGRKS
jgi:release factor glutamine methyltransferase